MKNLIEKHINYTALFEDLITMIKESPEDMLVLDEYTGKNEGNIEVVEFYDNLYKQEHYTISHTKSLNNGHEISFVFEPLNGRYGSIYFSNGNFRWVNDGNI